MFECSCDEKRNLVVIRYGKSFGVEDAERLYDELQEMLPKCQRGFKILADLSWVEEMKAEALPGIRKIMELCNRHGVSEVIRIIPDPDKDIGMKIMSFFHYSEDVKIVTCQSLEQAQL